MARNIENNKSGGAQIFQTVKTLFWKPYKPISVKNEDGHNLKKDTDKIKIIEKYFQEKYATKK